MITFEDRDDAGRRLARLMGSLRGQDGLVMGIPRGGVAVAFQVARELSLTMDVMVVRKIPVPWNTEAGFGAVGPDGTVTLNEAMLPHLSLPAQKIDALAAEVLEEVRRRMRVYRGERPVPSLRDRTVILVDDGVATGVTTLAAVRSARAQGAARVIVAAPVASASGIELIESETDEVFCLYIHPPEMFFAVASFYRHWSDMTDQEVLDYLSRPTPGPAAPR